MRRVVTRQKDFNITVLRDEMLRISVKREELTFLKNLLPGMHLSE
jgi:hypothetical protein